MCIPIVEVLVLSMATRRTKSVRVLRYSETFTAGLSSAVLEWLLIILLFVNAFFSYLVTKFARFCKLKIPCLLCSRLDHVFGNEKPGFYRDLFCGAHKLEISSLVVCHVHDKLVDVHGMCEGCLSSFANKKRSNSDTQKLLAYKLGTDYDLRSLRKHSMLDPSREKHCPCCNEFDKTRAHTHRSFPNASIGSKAPEIYSRLPPKVAYSGLNIFDGLAKRRAHVREHRVDPLSHIGYSNLKITSRSESEVPISDDDDASGPIRETNSLKEDIAPHHVLSEPRTIAANTSSTTSHENFDPYKLTSQTSASVLAASGQHNFGEANCMPSSISPISVEPDLEEFNWQQCETEPQLPALPNLITQHDDPSSPNAAKETDKGCKRSSNLMGSEDLAATSKNERGEVCKLETDLIPTMVRGTEKGQVVELSGDTCDVSQTIDVGHISSDECCATSNSDSVSNVTKAPGVKRHQVSSNSGRSFNLTDCAEFCKLTIKSKGGEASSMLSEQHTIKDFLKINQNLKLLPKRVSAKDSVSYMSPRMHEHHEELIVSDGASPIGLDRFQNEICIERNESGFESLDGSIFSEHEGENVLDLMNCQVLYDRKCLNALYKELDEERNASAIAANEAMAMITRLQEEKSALKMEASQYLRMMEEQAEFDSQAIQEANDLITEKEKEIQDLEAELDYYRIKYPEDEMEESIPQTFDDKLPNMTVKHPSLSSTVSNTNGACDSWSIKTSEDVNKSKKTDAISGDSHMSIINNSLFEDERLYISQCLKRLEKKLNLCSDDEVHMNMCNGVCPGKDGTLDDMEHDLHLQERNQVDEDGSPMQMDSHSPAQERNGSSAGDSQSVIQSNHYFDENNASIIGTRTDLVSIEREVLNLNERLETLEAEKDFLEHTINSLLYGNEGIKYIKEIADHLEELRKIGMRNREMDVA